MKTIFQRDLESFLRPYPVRQYRRNQNLVYAGDNTDSVYFLRTGRVRQYAISDEGNEIIVNVFRGNSFFPTNLNNKKSEYFYDAIDVIEVQVAPLDKLLDYLRKAPTVLMDILLQVQAGNERTLKRMTHMMSRSAYYRLAYELLVECQQNAADEDGKYELKLHEHEIASRAGMSRETASRQMKKLKLKGLVRVTRSSIVVLNLFSLRNELGSRI